MSTTPTPGPSKLSEFAVSLLLIAAGVWVLVKVVEMSWGWILVILAGLALVAAVVVLVRWWWSRGRL